MDWIEADLVNWDKHYRKSKDLQKIINDYIRSEREKALYLQEFGSFPKEYEPGSEGHLEWVNSIERSRYVKKLTQANPTHSAKRPSRSKKAVSPPVSPEPWRPPAH